MSIETIQRAIKQAPSRDPNQFFILPKNHKTGLGLLTEFGVHKLSLL